MARRQGFSFKTSCASLATVSCQVGVGCTFFLRRYATLESNWDKHKPELSDQENLDAFNSFTPGYPYRTDVDMDEFIPDTCPNKSKVLCRNRTTVSVDYLVVTTAVTFPAEALLEEVNNNSMPRTWHNTWQPQIWTQGMLSQISFSRICSAFVRYDLDPGYGYRCVCRCWRSSRRRTIGCARKTSRKCGRRWSSEAGWQPLICSRTYPFRSESERDLRCCQSLPFWISDVIN